MPAEYFPTNRASRSHLISFVIDSPRTGELLGLRGSHLLYEQKHPKAVISLGMTKGGKRQGVAEAVVIGYDKVVRFIQHWKHLSQPNTALAKSAGAWRKMFNDALEALRLQKHAFRPYSLRRGGATFWCTKHASLDKVLLLGRWQAPKTARLYINEGLSVLVELQLPATLPSL